MGLPSSVGHDDLTGVDGGIGFGQRVKDFVAVGAFGDNAGHKEWAANLFSLWHAHSGKKSGQRNAGVGLIRLGVAVENGDGDVWKRGKRDARERDDVSVVCERERCGTDSRRVMVHLLRGQIEMRNAGERDKSKDGEREGAGRFHKAYLNRLYSFSGLNSG